MSCYPRLKILTPAFGILTLFVSASCALEQEAATSVNGTSEALSSCSPALRWWREEREERQAELSQYIADNRADYESFRTTPAGNSGVPFVMFRLFPEVFPELWGSEADKLAVVGLGPDLVNPSRALPSGMGFAPSEPPIQTPVGEVRLNVAQLTCSSCHNGKVTDASGVVREVLGAPSPTFDFNRFRTLTAQTVNHPNYTAERFLAALAAKPMGWLYGDTNMLQQEAIERQVFAGGAANMLASVKAGVNGGVARLQATIYASTYAKPGAPNPTSPHPGSMDAMAGFAALATNPANLPTPEAVSAVLPPMPAFADHMPAWRQSERPRSKWGGEVVSPTHANTFAALGVVGSPFTTLMDNTNRSTRFSAHLPATPYPFDVDQHAAKRGERIFNDTCVSCHAPGTTKTMTPVDSGTDPWRAQVLTPYTVAVLRQMVKIACTDPTTCAHADGSAVADEDILAITGGYMAVPLDGIWARAPYFHNGSVPNLTALLTGKRPTTFYRGNTTYDQSNVGFVSTKAVGPSAALYDTTLIGNSNSGHMGATFYGRINFARDAHKLSDLLEYLKTL